MSGRPAASKAAPRAARQGKAGRMVLQLDGSWLKLVHAEGLPQASVRHAIAIPIQGLSDPEVLALLREKLAQGPNPVSVLIANPSQFTTVRLSNLPSTDPKEIRQIVELQAEQYTPYAKEEILTGFKLLGKDGDGYSRVLLAISHRSIIQRGVAIAEGMGWSIHRVGADIEGTVSWLALSRGKPASSGGLLLADMDSDTTSLLVLHEGRPLFHRSIACGASQVAADPGAGCAALIAEFQRSVEAFEGEGLNVPLAEVVLTGLADRVEGIAAQVQQALNLPATVLPQFAKCPVSREAAEQAASAPVSFAGLVGLAMAPSELDLTPPSVRLRQVFEGRARALMVLGGQGIALLLLLSFLAVEKTVAIQRQHAEVMREHKQMSAEAEWVGRSLDSLRIVRDRIANRGALLEVIALMSETLPPEVQLQSLTYASGDIVIVRGVSSELPKVYELVAALGKSPLFRPQVAARRVSKKNRDGKDISEFEIVCPLAKDIRAAEPGSPS